MKKLDTSSFKLWYTDRAKCKNGESIIVDKFGKNSVINVKKLEDRIIALKLVVKRETFNIINTYAPQMRLEKHHKVKFWDDLEYLV